MQLNYNSPVQNLIVLHKNLELLIIQPRLHKEMGLQKGPQPINRFVYQPPESHVYYETIASETEAIVVTSHETTMLHDGAFSMDFSMRRPSRMAD
ncbi:hypothetical protein BUALT_Bualt14G0118800 [Buddleja alternifolia]|uniref:Uncharacterized protein n=1 Tax=Buddleja alternifolia TaxID=168488 RepID=A0AAV6WQV5_9LAMI|nr:hypothetical protein BUALT_Bualt14G0118800 [Buddleja alternifolia]